MKKVFAPVHGGFFTVCVVVSLFTSGCAQRPDRYPKLTLPVGRNEHSEERYVTYETLVNQSERAVRDAEELRIAEVNTDLTLISADNPKLVWSEDKAYVLVATYTGTYYDDKVGQDVPVDPDRPIWVTACPDLKDWCDAHPLTKTTLPVRLKQLLGMPPDVQKVNIVEMWVRPRHLKRPSLDPDITRQIDVTKLSLNRSDFFPPQGDAAYQEWFYRQCALSYVMPNSKLGKYPWTRLGYTYDWGNPEFPHVGLSEFVILGGKDADGNQIKVRVKSVTPAQEYCLRREAAPGTGR